MTDKTKYCKDASPQMSPRDMADLIREAPPGPWPNGWHGWDNVRAAHVLLLEECLVTSPPYPGPEEGRGIVVSVNAKPGWNSGKYLENGYFPGAWVLLKELRRLGCPLPVIFCYMGELEWDPVLTALVEPLGVRVLDLLQELPKDPMRILAGWESKIYAILRAPFREVLYLDADNIPCIDPSPLFDTLHFKHYGAVFWPDVPPHDREEWLPEACWLNCGMRHDPTVRAVESGQLLIDKKKCWLELQAARFLNEHSDFSYKWIFGDKDTFTLGWHKICQREEEVGRPGLLHYIMPVHGPGGNGSSLFQYGFSGQVLFQHCTRNKASLRGYPAPERLACKTYAEEHLAELRRLWGGRLWHNDKPTSEELDLARAQIGKRYLYERGDLGSREIRLLEDHRIGRGLARCEVNWSVFRRGGEDLLVLTSLEGTPTVIFRRDGFLWRGAWLEYERSVCTLTPLEY